VLWPEDLREHLLAACPSEKPQHVTVRARIVQLAYRTKRARNVLIGKPYLGLRAVAKRCYALLGRMP